MNEIHLMFKKMPHNVKLLAVDYLDILKKNQEIKKKTYIHFEPVGRN